MSGHVHPMGGGCCPRPNPRPMTPQHEGLRLRPGEEPRVNHREGNWATRREPNRSHRFIRPLRVRGTRPGRPGHADLSRPPCIGGHSRLKTKGAAKASAFFSAAKPDRNSQRETPTGTSRKVTGDQERLWEMPPSPSGEALLPTKGKGLSSSFQSNKSGQTALTLTERGAHESRLHPPETTRLLPAFGTCHSHAETSR